VTIPALLVLEDGSTFRGLSCGAPGEVFGEIVFNTAMTGYQEVLSDPSYAGQIVTMTFPHIGICGTNGEDMESRGVFASGLVLRAASASPSNWRATDSLPAFLRRHGIVAIEGVDTRRLTRMVREAGAMRSALSTLDLDPTSMHLKVLASPALVDLDFVSIVASAGDSIWRTGLVRAERFPAVMAQGLSAGEFDAGIQASHEHDAYQVVALDSGMKYSIARSLEAVGCSVTVLPPTTAADDILALDPDGVFLANGPGDPTTVPYLYETVRRLVGQKPIFGICLGHQMLALALGASTYKLKYGHRGANQPVKNLLTGAIEVTSQNHGFCVDFGSIGPVVPEESGGIHHDPSDIAFWTREGVAPVVRSAEQGLVQLTHVNLNDMTVAGIRALDRAAFSVQYHPEAAPGPHDARYLFGEYVHLMRTAATPRASLFAGSSAD